MFLTLQLSLFCVKTRAVTVEDLAMKVLVVGSGGREHAVCTAFSKSSRVNHIFCASGNAGIAEIAECIDIKPTEIDRLAAFARTGKVDLTFVGGETSLALGIADEFNAKGLPIIGPGSAAARLESSKSFAKAFMMKHGVPTATYVVAASATMAIRSLEEGEMGDESTPLVVKADGLAAGKGVVIAANRQDAVDAITKMSDLVGAEAAEKIVLEEFLSGNEVSLMMFADGKDFALMPPTRDHKRIGEGDTGPNTGGMGTITDSSLLSDSEIREITDTMIRPTLLGCIDEGMPFRGVLFLGLMMTSSGPRLLEYNVRFGDPETQAILIRLDTDLVDICEAMIRGTLYETPIYWQEGSSACVVLASRGYPGRPSTGDIINGIDDARMIDGVEVFHAGTARDVDGQVRTAGGRVLGVTATGPDIDAALKKAYAAAEKISFEGMQYRRDIGKTAGAR